MHSGKKVRRFETSDATAVERLLHEAPQAAQWSCAALVGAARANTLLWVVEATPSSEIVGVIAMRTAADEAEILNLAIAPERRRERLGMLLVETGMAECSVAGARRVFLEVRESNETARAFYRCLGFVERGRRSKYYREPVEDAVVLWRESA